jgi:putative ABC transport system permease protein
VGIACFTLIFLYVHDEMSYDRYHTKADRIYRVAMSIDMNGVGERSSSCPFPLAFSLLQDYPDKVESVTRFFNFQAKQHLLTYGGQKHYEKNLFFADSTVTDIFDLEFVAGNGETALDTAFSLIISESAAHKYFGSMNPIGKKMIMGAKATYTVKAVFKDLPEQSHFRFDFLASFNTLRSYYTKVLKGWVWNPCWTYILLKEGVNPKELEDAFPEFLERHMAGERISEAKAWLQPLTDIHLHSDLDYEIQPNGSIKYMYIFMGIACFILLIACINFMNLATARSANRAREIGMRKTLGAYRSNLVVQFIAETLIVVVLSVLLAFALLEIMIPTFNAFTGKSLTIASLFTPYFLPLLLLSILALSIFSGLYPAYYMSSFKPIAVLRGVFRPGIRTGYLRKMLVVLQFSLSITLIVFTIVVYCQLDFTQKVDLGFKKDGLILLHMENTSMTSDFDSLKTQLLKCPDIERITGVEDIPGAFHNTHEFHPEGYLADQWYYFPTLVVRDDFVETMGIKIVAGRDYCSDSASDKTDALLVNETMVKYMGWGSNEEALGRKFCSYFGKERIVGVFKDFHTNSLYQERTPFVLNLKETPYEIAYYTRYMVVRVRPGRDSAAIAFMKKTWDGYHIPHPFQWSYLSDELDKLYINDKKLATLDLAFSILAMLIACLGLLGLTSYTIETRARESGIRKVLGSSPASIIFLLLRSFVLLVGISGLIAIPGAVAVSNNWLTHYAYNVGIPWWSFLIAVGIALFCAVLTIFPPAWRAARSNIVNAIKHNG